MPWTVEAAKQFLLERLLRARDPELVAFPNQDDLRGVVPTLGTLQVIAPEHGWSITHKGMGVFVIVDGKGEVLTFFGGGGMLQTEAGNAWTPIRVAGSRHRRLRIQRMILGMVPGLTDAVRLARSSGIAHVEVVR